MLGTTRTMLGTIPTILGTTPTTLGTTFTTPRDSLPPPVEEGGRWAGTAAWAAVRRRRATGGGCPGRE